MWRLAGAYLVGVWAGTLVHAGVEAAWMWRSGFESATDATLARKLADLLLMVAILWFPIFAASVAWACMPFFLCYGMLRRIRTPRLVASVAAASLAGAACLPLFVGTVLFLGDSPRPPDVLRSSLDVLPWMMVYSVAGGVMLRLALAWNVSAGPAHA